MNLGRRLSLGLLVLVGFGCASSPPPAQPPLAPAPPPKVEAPPPVLVTPDAEFRQKPPAPDGKVEWAPPKIASAKLKNGLRVFVVERHDLPIVSVRLVLTLGLGDVPDARPGSLSFMGAMLDKGTKKRSALQLTDDLRAIGAQHNAWVDMDSGGASIRVLADQLDAGLEILSDIALAPLFPDAEIDRLRTQRLTFLQQEKSSAPAISQNLIVATLFGRAHPYGRHAFGEEADLKALQRAELVKAYERMFTVSNAAIVVAGDVSQATLLPKLESTFGKWVAKKGGVARKIPKTPAKIDTDKRIVLVDRPGAAQTQVQVVRHGISHTMKDREQYIIANAVLGGSFSSRINLNLREKHSYTYGARSHWSVRHGAGPFTAGGAIITEKTGPAIKEILAEIDGLRKDGPTDEELSLAKESIRLAMPARFETTSEVANAVADLVVYDLPIDDYEKRQARIDAVTAADVKRVANEYFTSSAMTITVVGAKSAIASQLDELGLGAIDERDATGNPLGSSSGDKAPPSEKSEKSEKTEKPAKKKK